MFAYGLHAMPRGSFLLWGHWRSLCALEASWLVQEPRLCSLHVGQDAALSATRPDRFRLMLAGWHGVDLFEKVQVRSF